MQRAARRRRFHINAGGWKTAEQNMTRIQALFVTAAMAFALPLGAAVAQTPSTSTAAPLGSVSNPARTLPGAPDNVPSPMQEQAMAPAPNMAPMNDGCGSPRVVTMKDEFGHKYNCRGDRVR
jgi:hypothetical protein